MFCVDRLVVKVNTRREGQAVQRYWVWWGCRGEENAKRGMYYFRMLWNQLFLRASNLLISIKWSDLHCGWRKHHNCAVLVQKCWLSQNIESFSILQEYTNDWTPAPKSKNTNEMFHLLLEKHCKSQRHKFRNPKNWKILNKNGCFIFFWDLVCFLKEFQWSICVCISNSFFVVSIHSCINCLLFIYMSSVRGV